jgi:hypothetical protein
LNLNFGFLLLPLVGSFFFLWNSNYWSYRVQRAEKDRLLLVAVTFAGAFLFVARLIVMLPRWFHFNPSFLKTVEFYVRDFAPFPYGATMLLSVVLGMVAVPLSNWFYGRPQSGDAADVQAGSIGRQRRAWSRVIMSLPGRAVLELFSKARDGSKPVLVSLKCRKVYVGYIVSISLEHDATHFEIIPAMSGYRTTEDLVIEMSNRYEDTLKYFDAITLNQRRAPSDREPIPAALRARVWDLTLVVRLDEVLSASRFDAVLFSVHQNRRKAAAAAAAGGAKKGLLGRLLGLFQRRIVSGQRAG